MRLSPKATRFVIEALEHYQKFHDRRLRDEELSDDDVADLVNDRQFLDAIKQDLRKYEEELAQERERVNTNVKAC